MASSITTCPTDKAAAAVEGATAFRSFPLTDASVTTGMTMTGESNGAYVIENVGAHFDGDGDRVLLDVGTDYATSTSGQGFAISYWFTKSVCNNEQDRFETLYQHTSSPDRPTDLFASGSDASCTETATSDACGGGTQCDGMGDGPCSCDPVSRTTASNFTRTTCSLANAEAPPVRRVRHRDSPGRRRRVRGGQRAGRQHSLLRSVDLQPT